MNLQDWIEQPNQSRARTSRVRKTGRSKPEYTSAQLNWPLEETDELPFVPSNEIEDSVDQFFHTERHWKNVERVGLRDRCLVGGYPTESPEAEAIIRDYDESHDSSLMDDDEVYYEWLIESVEGR